jgi:DNA-binding protein HU-beta
LESGKEAGKGWSLMTRRDLINKVAKEFGLKNKEAESIVKYIFHEIVESVKKGERVSIQGFGAFELRELKDRKIRNPRTGEVIRIPSRKKMVFIPSQKVKTELN